ncbi:MAG: POTRA domain-containing protein [Candidatus Acidiferrales bacterium]
MILNQLRNRTLLVSALLLLSASCANAQSSASYNLAAIHFVGLHRYTAEQGIAASGLHIGSAVSLGDLQSAAEHLSQTGAFDSVSFQYSTRGNDLTAKFGVTETKDVLACIFDNFVWFSDADLDHVLRQHVPLYTGESPVRGDTVEQIRGALQDFLRANGIAGDVSEIPYGSLGKLSGLLFHVDGTSQPIKSIAFSGEAALTDKQLLAASAGLTNQDFSVTNVASYASSALLPLYYERGYLRSQFGRAKVSPLDATAKGPVTDVAIVLPVTEGNQYSWNGATWSGNKALTTNELVKAVGMNPQEVANQLKIDAGFANARKAYLSQGYIQVRIDPRRDLDDAAKLASYSVQINEGSQFHMGQVFFEGLPDVAAALAKKWKLKPGDVYDATYPPDFFKNTAGKELAQAGVAYHTSSIKEAVDPSALIVNVHFQFR